MSPSGSDVPAVLRAGPRRPAALQGEAVRREALRLVRVRTQSETGEGLGDGQSPVRHLLLPRVRKHEKSRARNVFCVSAFL